MMNISHILMLIAQWLLDSGIEMIQTIYHLAGDTLKNISYHIFSNKESFVSVVNSGSLDFALILRILLRVTFNIISVTYCMLTEYISLLIKFFVTFIQYVVSLFAPTIKSDYTTFASRNTNNFSTLHLLLESIYNQAQIIGHGLFWLKVSQRPIKHFITVLEFMVCILLALGIFYSLHCI